MPRTYSGEDIKIIQLFEALTGAEVVDFYRNNQLVFIVREGHMGLALGRNKKNIQRLREVYKQRIKIVESSNDLKRFIKQLLFPIKPLEVKIEEETIIIKAASSQDKAMILGREKKNLKAIQEALRQKGCNKKIIVE
ncbi:NusA-like transcription termination signal-binding factor [Candidatus Woesearchaeota archaeon]|nr:NusA-like transcription termination signal-binding factor [Candidatus Woesearchaeota archaeon]